MSLVLDASVALAWIFTRQDPAEAKRASDLLSAIKSQPNVVPAFWRIEILNSLATYQRRGNITLAQGQTFLEMVKALPISIDDSSLEEREVELLTLAATYGLTAYDALYFDLALRTGSGVATFDKRLAAACVRAGIQVL